MLQIRQALAKSVFCSIWCVHVWSRSILSPVISHQHRHLTSLFHIWIAFVIEQSDIQIHCFLYFSFSVAVHTDMHSAYAQPKWFHWFSCFTFRLFHNRIWKVSASVWILYVYTLPEITNYNLLNDCDQFADVYRFNYIRNMSWSAHSYKFL